MELWIPITFAAAFLQNLRSATQKHLKAVMGTTGATFVRFGFGVPFAVAFVAILRVMTGDPVPGPSAPFLAWVVLGAMTQIAGTFLLIHLFSFRNFAVGTAYSRTEPAQAALFALLFLGETVTGGALVAIGLSVLGVMLISVSHTQLSVGSMVTSLGQRNALIGLASGTLFGVAAVSYRAASLELGGPNFLMQAAVTLLWTITLQSVVMLAWMILRDRGELARVVRAWKPATLAGLFGATASFGWFIAMTLQHAAVVKALGQVEMLFTFAASVFFFKERINHREVAGCLLITAGILVLLLIG